MRPHPFTVLVLVGALTGFLFATVSTYDFVVHLDRQLHGIHCSYFPGLGASDTEGNSGCHATLMSPYSSVFRQQFWGGLPVSLPGMSVFAFLLFLAADLVITRRQADLRSLALMLGASTVPVVTSIVMGYLSFVELSVACKSCIGIYVASGLVFTFSLALAIRSFRRRRSPAPSRPVAASAPTADGADAEREVEGQGEQPWAGKPPEGRDQRKKSKKQRGGAGGPLSYPGIAILAMLGGAFVLIPALLYIVIAPRFDEYVGTCGALPQPADRQGVLVALGGGGDVTAIEVVDPLCAACRGLESRLEASGLSTQIRRKALLFPLDSECNWMIDRSIHPGACAVSEAILCAGDEANEVLQWAFDEQDRILEATRVNPAAAQQLVTTRFPQLSWCIGSADVRARLNRALRWSVSNQLPVSAPQIYVEGLKLCDEDTDLGLEYMLPRLIQRARGEGQARAGLPSPLAYGIEVGR